MASSPLGWLWSQLLRVRVTLVYAVILTVVTTSMQRLSPVAQDRVIEYASTNLHNLRHGRIDTLIGSAFVVDAGPVYQWLPWLVCLLGIGELLWRSGRLVVAFALGHVGATLLVAVGLAASVEFGWEPRSITTVTDVGMSYGAIAVLGAVTVAIPPRVRPIWFGWWLTVACTVVAISRDFTDVGHATALVLGIAVATRFGRPQPWTALLLVPLALGAAFGFLILVNNLASTVMVTVAGIAGAVVGAGWAGRHSVRRALQGTTRSSL